MSEPKPSTVEIVLSLIWIGVLNTIKLLPGILAGALLGVVFLGPSPLNLIPAAIGAYAMHEYYEKHGHPF